MAAPQDEPSIIPRARSHDMMSGPLCDEETPPSSMSCHRRSEVLIEDEGRESPQPRRPSLQKALSNEDFFNKVKTKLEREKVLRGSDDDEVANQSPTTSLTAFSQLSSSLTVSTGSTDPNQSHKESHRKRAHELACAGLPGVEESPTHSPMASHSQKSAYAKQLLPQASDPSSPSDSSPRREPVRSLEGHSLPTPRIPSPRLEVPSLLPIPSHTAQRTRSPVRSGQPSMTEAPIMQQSPRCTNLCLAVNLKAGETIGMGSYGRVFTAQHQTNGCLIAVKEILLKDGLSDVDKLGKELEFYQEFDHPHIVRYLGHEFAPVPEPERLFIFLEYCSGGSVASQLRVFGPLDTSLIVRYTSQLLQGIGYLHSHQPPVVHRDLKCANILLTQDGNVKIADFGCSKKLLTGDDLKGDVQNSIVGSIFWMAPETLRRDRELTCAVDVWSLGCCVLEMATAQHPWADRHLDNIFHAYKVIGESEELPDIPGHLSSELLEFLGVCLRRAPQDRMPTKALLWHPFIMRPASAECLSPTGPGLW